MKKGPFISLLLFTLTILTFNFLNVTTLPVFSMTVDELGRRYREINKGNISNGCGSIQKKLRHLDCSSTHTQASDVSAWLSEYSTAQSLASTQVFKSSDMAIKPFSEFGFCRNKEPKSTSLIVYPDGESPFYRVGKYATFNFNSSRLSCIKNLFIVPSSTYTPNKYNNSNILPVPNKVIEYFPRFSNVEGVNIYLGGLSLDTNQDSFMPVMRRKGDPVEVSQDRWEVELEPIYRANGCIGTSHIYLNLYNDKNLEFEKRLEVLESKINKTGGAAKVYLNQDVAELYNEYVTNEHALNVRCGNNEAPELLITNANDVVLENLAINGTRGGHAIKVSDLQGNFFINHLSIGESFDSNVISKALTGIRATRIRGEVHIQNSYIGRVTDDAINYFGGKGLLAKAHIIGGTKKTASTIKTCLLMNSELRVGDMLQLVRPENGAIDYLFEVSSIINDGQCNKLAESNSGIKPAALKGWKPYYVYLDIVTGDNTSLSSKNTDLVKFFDRYINGEYSEDLSIFLNSAINNGLPSYYSEDYKSYINSKGSFNSVTSAHYIVYNLSNANKARFENNVIFLTPNSAIKSRASNTVINDNFIIGSRYGIHMSQVTRGANFEGPLPYNVILSNNLSYITTYNSAIEILTEGWRNSSARYPSQDESVDHSIIIDSTNRCSSRLEEVDYIESESGVLLKSYVDLYCDVR